MQIPADPLDAAALDVALQPGQDQWFRAVVEIDWDQDGTYGNALSDVSEAFSSLKISRELADSTPGADAVLSGTSAGELTVALNGSMLIGAEYVTISEILAPYNSASPLYGVEAPGKPIRAAIETYTSRGWISLTQFTGWIDERTVRLSNNQVQLTALDIPPALRDPTFWPPWAVDGPAAARVQDYAPQRGLASSVVDQILNRAGRRTRPRPPWEHLSGVYALTWLPLCGSFASAVGRMLSQAPWGNFQLFPEVYKISPGIDPEGEYWIDGPFGLARSGESNRYPGSLIYTTRDIQPTWTSGCTSITAWIYCGPTAPGYDATPSATLRPPVVQVHYGYSTTAGNYYAYRLSIASAGPTLQVQVENGVTSTLRYGTYTPGSNGWRHVHAQLDHSTGSVVRCKLIVDGTTQVDFTGSTGSTTSAPVLNPLFLPQVGVHLRPGVDMSDVMAWQEAGAPTVVPERTVTVGAVVDRSLNQITHLPVPGDPGWDVCREIAAAEFAAWLVDAQGMVYFRNRDNIRSTADPQVLTLSYPSDVGTLDSQDGRANSVAVSAQSGEASWKLAWEAASVDQVVVPPGIQTWIFPIDDDVIAIESGTVPRLYQSAESASTLPVWSSKVDSGYVFVIDGTETEGTDQNMLLLTDQSGLDDRQYMRIVVTNTSTNTGRFRLKSDGTAGTDPQPALRIAGLVLARPPTETATVVSQANLDADGHALTLNLTGGDWRHHLDSVKDSAVYVLRRTTQTIPTFDRIETPGDPRREIGDRFTLEFGSSAQRVSTFAAGIDLVFDDRGLRNTLTLKATHSPGGWVLDDAVMGLLESTAVLG